MNNISEIGKHCCGCRACEQVCSVRAISFHEDDEGFLQPSIDETVCVDCGKCLRTCPAKNEYTFDCAQSGYAAKTNNKTDILSCSSGGVFYVLAKYIIEKGGVVCGCSIDEQMMPVHILASNLEDARKMRGSKYVQSNIGDAYTLIRENLKDGRWVLFTGVPCQVAGLRNFLGKDYTNLFCVDVICHGVPSRKLYSMYLKWLSRKYSGKVVGYEFRSKKRHKWSLTMNLKIKKKGKVKDYVKMASLDPYYYNFLQGTIYRESCYSCIYAQAHRPGDLTLGDFWGIERSHPTLFDINGVSCILVNSPRGEDLLNNVFDKMTLNKVPVNSIIDNNGNLRHPTIRPPMRDSIYKKVIVEGFDHIPYNISSKDYFIDTLKNLIPNSIRCGIKRIIRHTIRK